MESKENDFIERLKSDVERRLGFRIESPADFTALSECLFNGRHGYVSTTTLKRVWGYISDKGNAYNPSKFTLRALCSLIGFRSVEEYRRNDSGIQSVVYSGELLDVSQLPAGAEVLLGWNPNRKVRLQHIGNGRFEVIANENSRLCEGDIVECGGFTQYAPAYMRVYRGGKPPVTYVAGSAQGVTFKVSSSEELPQ